MASNFPDTSVNNPETGVPWVDGDTWFDSSSDYTYIWYSPVWRTGEASGSDFVKVAGDNMIGDLTLGTDKITLDATSGSGTFAGQITAGDGSASQGTSGVGIGVPGYVSVSHSNRTSQNCLAIYDTTNAKEAFSVTGAGAGTFAGQVTGNQSFFSQPDAGYSGMYIYGDNTSEAEALIVRPAGNQDISAQINFDGSAKFTSNSSSGATPSLFLTQDNPNGNFLTCKNGSTGGNTIQFGVTGTASFGGNMTIGPANTATITVGTPGILSADTIDQGTYSAGSIGLTRRSSSALQGEAFLTGFVGTDRKMCLFSNGTAAFNSTLYVLREGEGGGSQNLTFDAETVYETKITATNYSGAGPANTPIIFGGLNASSAGYVEYARATPSGIVFNLESEDETKYTTTTDSEGVETRVYNGTVLDVKDRIQNVLARMDAIEANEITDDATDSALLTLIASLTARLDERDTAIAALTARVSTLES